MDELSSLDPAVRALLDAHGFGEIPFARLARRLVEEGFDPERNRIRGRVEPPPPESIVGLPAPGTAERERCEELGREALAAGRVGVVVLNGGMATRFGGAVKGTLPAIDGRSFLELKLRQVERVSGGRAPFLLMDSFATHEPTRRHLESLGLEGRVRFFTQFAALRLSPDGKLFREADGRVSPYAPGHGDLPFALVRSGELERFRRDGGRWLAVSNVDNLGAGLDPAVVGLHVARGRPMSVELVRLRPGDAGGLPAAVDGRVTIVEAFRLPRGFAAGRVGLFNTNTFVFDVEALARPVELGWFPVCKTVDERPAIQFERLLGQLADFVETTWMHVPREGAGSRFLPIKVPDDLREQEPALREVLRAQGVLDPPEGPGAAGRGGRS